jgi:hypothetical protein
MPRMKERRVVPASLPVSSSDCMFFPLLMNQRRTLCLADCGLSTASRPLATH